MKKSKPKKPRPKKRPKYRSPIARMGWSGRSKKIRLVGTSHWLTAPDP